MLKIATFAVPLSGNKGSASMLLGLMDSFKDSGIDAHFEVFSYYPEADEVIAQTIPNCRIHAGHPKDLAFCLIPALISGFGGEKSRDAASALKSCHIALMIGGTTFADSMLFKVPWNTLASLPALCTKTPSIWLSQTFGPIESRINRFFAKPTLSKAHTIHGRGRQSTANVKELGVNIKGDISYQPDLSFAMEVPSLDEIKRIPAVLKLLNAIHNSGKKPIGIAPNTIVLEKSSKNGIDYIDFLTQVAADIDKEGFFPVLLPHSYRADEKGYHNNDRFLCQEIYKRCKDRFQIYFIDEDFNPRLLRSIIGIFHLLVASRFHSMISALSQAVPPITYGWGAHKYSEVLSEFKLEDTYHSFKDLKSTSFNTVLKKSLHLREKHVELIETHLPKVISESKSIVNKICSVHKLTQGNLLL